MAVVDPSADSLSGAAYGASVRRQRGRNFVVALIVLLAVGILPLFNGVSELTRAQQVLIYVMVALGLNISLGIAGEFSVAQPVVMAVSAYTAGILSVERQFSAWLTLPCAVAAGIVTGVVLSAPGFRRLRGWYLAITTFFAAVVLPDVVNLTQSVSGGSNGLSGIGPLPGVGFTLGSSPTEFEIVFGICLLLLLGTYNLSRSTWGVVLRSVRDAPLAAESCGINLSYSKFFVSVCASFPVAVAGWVWAHVNTSIGASQFTLNLSIIIIAGVVLGGMGTVWGPVIGVTIVEFVSLWIGPFSSYNTLLVGAAVVLFAIVLPRGVVSGWWMLVSRTGLRWLRIPVITSGVVDDEMIQALPAQDVGADDEAAHQVGEVAFQAESIEKSFFGVEVLRGVDLTVRRGEIVGLIGSNGSGKTTLINIITGHVRPDAGSVKILQRRSVGKAPHAVAALGVRRTFQIPQLVGELSVIENVRLGLLGSRRQEALGSILQLPRHRRMARQDKERVGRICRLIGLPVELWMTPVDGMSLGLRRVIEVARALVSGPALVLLDEPAVGLSKDELGKLHEVIRRAATASSGILLIEHNLDFVRQVTDRVYEMQGGKAIEITAHPAAGRT
jgi:branched-chain amino acid transport system permease protein